MKFLRFNVGKASLFLSIDKIAGIDFQDNNWFTVYDEGGGEFNLQFKEDGHKGRLMRILNNNTVTPAFEVRD